MTNLRKVAPKKTPSSKKERYPLPKFEIIYEHPNRGSKAWSELRRALGPVVEAARDVLGDIYVSAAQAVLERKEEWEDRRAERQARQHKAHRAAKQANAVPGTFLLEAGARRKNRPASTSNSSV